MHAVEPGSKRVTPKRALSLLGSLLAATGIAYVGYRLFLQAPDLRLLSPASMAALLVAAGAYAAALLLLALSWKRILNHLGIVPDLRWVLTCYSDYQVSKYVPGNVANIIGRQIHGARMGYGQKSLAFSTAIELGGLLMCGAVFWLMWLMLKTGTSPATVVLAGLGCFACACVGIALVGSRDLLAASLCQMAFLAMSGSIFSCLVLWVAGDPSSLGGSTVVPLICVFNAAWLVGMVTPGAPAGVGVRDGLLLSWATAMVHSDKLAFVVLLSRLSTILGDVVFWLMVRIVGARPASDHEP